MNFNDLPLINNKPDHRFELEINGEYAFIDYKQYDDLVLLIHTGVPQKLQGKGVAAALVSKTLHYILQHKWKTKIYCGYILAYLQRHPGWEKILA